MGHIKKGCEGKVTIDGVDFAVKGMEITVAQVVFQEHMDSTWKTLASGLQVPSGLLTGLADYSTWNNAATTSARQVSQTLDESIKAMLQVKRDWAWRERVSTEHARLARQGFECNWRQAERLLIISEWQTRSLMAVARYYRMRIR
jgi:hypothetical protein